MLTAHEIILQATPQVAPVSIDLTFGAAYVGVVVGAALYGVTVLQTYNYYTSQTDGWFIKILVGAVFAFDTTHQVLISHTVYIYVISNYNDPAFQANVVWSLLAEVLFNGFTAFLVQGFLARRIWHLSNKSLILIVPVAALIFAEFGCVMAFGIISLHRVRTFEELTTLKGLSIAVNALAAAGDILIAVILCAILDRSKTGFRKTDTMVSKLMTYAINTGLLTSLCALASLISITAAPNTFVYITFFFCIGRFYANSLLATLNARSKIRAAVDAVTNTTSNLSFTFKSTLPRFMQSKNTRDTKTSGVSVRVATQETDHGNIERSVKGFESTTSVIGIGQDEDDYNYSYPMNDIKGNRSEVAL